MLTMSTRMLNKAMQMSEKGSKLYMEGRDVHVVFVIRSIYSNLIGRDDVYNTMMVSFMFF